MARWKAPVDFLLTVTEHLFLPLTVEALQGKTTQKTQPDKVVRWCPDGDFGRFFCVLYFSETRAIDFRPAF